MPDTGKISVYRSASGFGIRLDGGNGFTGSEISPYYDSLLVKTTSWDRTFHGAARKALRSIKKFRIRGVKTNVPFLINVLNHPTFLEGNCYTSFIEDTKDLFNIKGSKDRASKLMNFIGDIIVNEKYDSSISDIEELVAEEAERLGNLLKLEDWQLFYVDSILQHDYAAGSV